jgi:hypothetical protein
MFYLGKGYSMDVLLESWPEISRSAAKEAISLATQALLERHNAPSHDLSINRRLARSPVGIQYYERGSEQVHRLEWAA